MSEKARVHALDGPTFSPGSTALRAMLDLDVPVVHQEVVSDGRPRCHDARTDEYLKRRVAERIAAPAPQHVFLAVVGAQHDSDVIAFGCTRNACARNLSSYRSAYRLHFTF
jgi:hypothetical protein